ncbi:hypothetical protein ACFOVU_12540 [Nocardiopsis sediminis]|uniref:Uncharacterized protein n=1 Tax=Nocardiopsis sediminis TaxID=1778267 RepID=A0ABV8FMY3_9ACTN
MKTTRLRQKITVGREAGSGRFGAGCNQWRPGAMDHIMPTTPAAAPYCCA